jgi:hypothetical protein
VDKFDFWKIVSSVNWPAWLDWTILIDLSGFTLAIIGFLNLAPRIEVHFREVRDNAAHIDKRMNVTIKRIFPLHKNWWRLFKEGLRIIAFPILPAFLGAAFITGEYERIWLWSQNTHWGWLASIAISAPFGVFALSLFSAFVANRFTKYLAWVIWRIVSVLSYPPSGVLGSIGLAVAGTSFILNHIN